MDQKKIDRINELARKKKTVGLTEPEKLEQQILRQEYLDNIRRNMRSLLENVSIVEEDGSITDMKDVIAAKEAGKEYKKPEKGGMPS